MTKKRIPVEIVGIELGTASGWDMVDDFVLFFYDFKPAKPYVNIVPENFVGGIQINQINGDFEFFQIDVEDPVKTIKFKELFGVC